MPKRKVTEKGSKDNNSRDRFHPLDSFDWRSYIPSMLRITEERGCVWNIRDNFPFQEHQRDIFCGTEFIPVLHLRFLISSTHSLTVEYCKNLLMDAPKQEITNPAKFGLAVKAIFNFN